MPVGQLLVRALSAFRADLYARAEVAEFTDIRPAHLQVFGNIDWRGSRLTYLAARAGMTRPSMGELVDELEERGYLERRPDPTDRRAKLICLTREGRRVLIQALRAVREIEQDYALVLGKERFEVMCGALQDLIVSHSESRSLGDDRPE